MQKTSYTNIFFIFLLLFGNNQNGEDIEGNSLQYGVIKDINFVFYVFKIK